MTLAEGIVSLSPVEGLLKTAQLPNRYYEPN